MLYVICYMLLHTKDQGYTLRVWHVIVSLMRGLTLAEPKRFGPARVKGNKNKIKWIIRFKWWLFYIIKYLRC